METKYNAYLDEWKGQVKSWLETNNYELAVDDFVKLYDKMVKQEKAKKLAKKKEQDE